MPDPHHILSGAMVRRLMRKHRVTINGLAQKFKLTKKRIREVRKDGLRDFLADEWCYMITGHGPVTPAPQSWPNRSLSTMFKFKRPRASIRRPTAAKPAPSVHDICVRNIEALPTGAEVGKWWSQTRFVKHPDGSFAEVGAENRLTAVQLVASHGPALFSTLGEARCS